MGLLAENQGVCLPFHTPMLFVLCILGERKLTVVHTLSQCPQLPSGERTLCTATSSSGSSRKVLACVPYGGPFEPVPRDPASSFPSSLLLSVGRVQLCLTVSSPSSEICQVRGLADDLASPRLASFLPYVEGNGKERWLLTWRRCNSHLTPLPATCLSDRR